MIGFIEQLGVGVACEKDETLPGLVEMGVDQRQPLLRIGFGTEPPHLLRSGPECQPTAEGKDPERNRDQAEGASGQADPREGVEKTEGHQRVGMVHADTPATSLHNYTAKTQYSLTAFLSIK